MSVAIRAITRVQDADDFGSVPGVGNDGYALTWDNGAGEFVLAAAGVVDHGALTGLSDDDHTGYALLAGRSGGQTLYGGTAANDDITIHGTSNATRTTSYVLLQPTAGNVGIGTSAPDYQLTITGASALVRAYRQNAASAQAAPGLLLDRSRASGANIQAGDTLGKLHFRGIITSAPVDYGMLGFIASDTVGSGRFVFTASDLSTERMVILNSGNVGIGTSSPATILHALTTDTGTSAVVNIVTLGHNTSGTAAAGFGGGLAFNLHSSTTVGQSAGLVAASWIVATHASRTARLALSAYDFNGVREGVRIDTDGSAALLGFYGHAAVAQQVLATGAGATADNIITALQALGLVKQS